MSQRRGGDDGFRTSGDGDLPELPPEWRHLVVPDDPRELAAEAEEVRAELRAEVRRNRWRRLVFTRRWQRYGLSGPLVSLALMLVAAIASLVVVVLPSAPPAPERAPLASPTVSPGTVGGLLPDIHLGDGQGHSVALRDIRPAVLLMMGPACACERVATDLVAVSHDALVPVELVGVNRPPARPQDASNDRVRALVDPDGLLTRTITSTRPAGAVGPVAPAAAGAGPTAVLVRSDGVIAQVVPDLRDATKLRGELAGLTVV